MHDEDTCCVDGCSQPPHVRHSRRYPHLSGACKHHYMRVAAYRPPPVREPLPTRECLWCGAEFQPLHAPHRCCSKSCSTSWSIYGRPRYVPATKACEFCGVMFTARRPDHRFCSKLCIRRNRGGAAPEHCVSCGDTFWRPGRTVRCAACAEVDAAFDAFERDRRSERRLARRLIRPVMVPGRTSPPAGPFTAAFCSECGEGFVARGKLLGPQRSGWRVFCSKSCGDRASRRDHRHRRRARREGKRVSRAKVFERDGWACRLCGDPLDRDAAVPHPRAAVMDHIVPLAIGGEHAEYNVQAAHFLCNSQKRDQLQGQVALPL